MTQIAKNSQYFPKCEFIDETQVYEYLSTLMYTIYEYVRLEKWIGKIPLKRAPKVEFYISKNVDGEEMRPVYRWGQSEMCWHAGYPMPPMMLAIAKNIKEKFGEDVNHAISIFYHSGTDQHAPPHHDKQIGMEAAKNVPLDMAEHSSFYVFSFGDPRVFTLQTTSKTKPAERGVVWQEALAHGSLLRISAQDNKELYHAVYKAGKKHGARYSLIFRDIVSFIPVDTNKAVEANSTKYLFDPDDLLGKAEIVSALGKREREEE